MKSGIRYYQVARIISPPSVRRIASLQSVALTVMSQPPPSISHTFAQDDLREVRKLNRYLAFYSNLADGYLPARRATGYEHTFRLEIL